MRDSLDFEALKKTQSRGPVVELVDALDSKSSVRKDVGVRFSPGPPKLICLKVIHSILARRRISHLIKFKIPIKTIKIQ